MTYKILPMRGSKLAGRAALYTHRNIPQVLAGLSGRNIHRAAEIPLYSFGRGFIDTVARTIERRTKLSLSITERQLYVDVDGRTFSTTVAAHRLGEPS